ncbi:hypothetical protein [Arcticibacter sp. MXS-1]|uniref:hypothetical protein n=1 Tax=Arcticibacter sp. MXS-1 TaxID=3341726 RepID=UPI0035A8365C
MKRIIYTLSLTGALMLGAGMQDLRAEGLFEKDAPKKEIALTEEQKEQRLEAIKNRVEEIKAMDKSHLSRQERKELRKELKEMKEQARVMTGGGVYLSVGAIIIIILVLILIL